jgi:hypothetical protein
MILPSGVKTPEEIRRYVMPEGMTHKANEASRKFCALC